MCIVLGFFLIRFVVCEINKKVIFEFSHLSHDNLFTRLTISTLALSPRIDACLPPMSGMGPFDLTPTL